MHGYRGADYGRISSRACWKYKTEHASAEVTNFSRRRATVGAGARAAGMSAARDDTSPEASTPPVTVQFLEHLTAPGGYGLSAENVTMGLSQWRESEIVAALLRDVERRAPDAIVGRIFTAVNQDGLVVLIGEIRERVAAEWGEEIECKVADSVEEAVALARDLAEAGGAVLFSPGTSSFDMFTGYAERGDVFCRAVDQLT